MKEMYFYVYSRMEMEFALVDFSYKSIFRIIYVLLNKSEDDVGMIEIWCVSISNFMYKYIFVSNFKKRSSKNILR